MNYSEKGRLIYQENIQNKLQKQGKLAGLWQKYIQKQKEKHTRKQDTTQINPTPPGKIYSKTHMRKQTTPHMGN